MFKFNFSDELKLKIRKLLRKDKKRVEIIYKKVKEIINNNNKTIDRYKNLKYNLKQYKRVHINRHFVLVFKVNKQNNHILFEDFAHHDDVYKK